MIALLLTALATEPLEPTPDAPAGLEWPETVAVMAVLDDVPAKKQRLKAIRYAMRKQPALIGGRDWGRVLCFRFREQRDTAIVETALGKAKLVGVVREADNCEVPPREAFLPPKPKASRLVVFQGDQPDDVVHTEMGALLDLKLGLTAIRVQDGVHDRVCLEFDREPDDEALTTTLGTLTVPVDRTEPVTDCAIVLEPR
ncbi:MAG: hypothetical protein H6737_02805 [Alphaproteobacteria bacterium]|nr:hypothetical protein [Alphaproteobacteria bacterium]